jgi:hypothetical protein
MHILLRSWRYSLDSITPSRLPKFFWSALKNVFRTVTLSMWLFGPLIAIDIALFFMFGDALANASMARLAAAKSISPIVIMLLLIQSITWFMVTSIHFLLLRKESTDRPQHYIAHTFFKYIQLHLLFSLFGVVTAMLVISAGITKLPDPNWFSIAAVRIIQLMTAFFWLDQPTKPIYLLRSVDRTINLLFYNAPLIAIWGGLLWCADMLLSKMATWLLAQPLSRLLLAPITEQLAAQSYTLKQLVIIITLKYGLFIIELLFTALLLNIYRRKRGENYAQGLFE